MTDFCALKGCDQPAIPPTFRRDETTPFWTGRSGIAIGGLGLCDSHDEQMTALVRHRKQVLKLSNSQPDASTVYFLHCTRLGPYMDLIKIGTTDKPAQRRHQIGGRLLLLEDGGRRREGQLHAKFWHLWVVGEWYRPGVDLLGYIEERRRESA